MLNNISEQMGHGLGRGFWVKRLYWVGVAWHTVQLSYFPGCLFLLVFLKSRGISYSSSLRQRKSIKKQIYWTSPLGSPKGTSNLVCPRQNLSFSQNLPVSFTQAQGRNLGFFPGNPPFGHCQFKISNHVLLMIHSKHSCTHSAIGFNFGCT